ncbi:hypothetical protein BN2537_7363 [Streptomyces venezuelae]|nr:hypothetical protein BN2537_7363 [Streptomyces venezuelae]
MPRGLQGGGGEGHVKGVRSVSTDRTPDVVRRVSPPPSTCRCR